MDSGPIYFPTGGVPVKAWTKGLPIESSAMSQLYNLAKMPFIHKHVAVMADVHVGIGATVGSVIPTKGAVIPAAVGVDIGCGMMAVRCDGLTANDLPDSLSGLRQEVERVVPVGFGQHPAAPKNHPWLRAATHDLTRFLREKHPTVGAKRKQVLECIITHQFGTLGGGNHFIELCLDENDEVWVMLHSGSRGIGNLLGHYFIELARQDMRKWIVNLPDKDLAYLPEETEHFEDYWYAVQWAQEYAKQNRERMMERVLQIVAGFTAKGFFTSHTVVQCHHNYVEIENHYGANVYVTRKGAVRAREGDMGIIPGSMGAKSFIVRGKGNAESFQSCSHGAGRRMSRSEAKRRFTVEDHVAATDGVECRKDAGVIDETPDAYKKIEEVMAAQEDLVDVVHTLKQVVCVKG